MNNWSEIIWHAASNPWSIIALGMLILGRLAIKFFRGERVTWRAIIFLLMYVGFGAVFYELTHEVPNESEQVNASIINCEGLPAGADKRLAGKRITIFYPSTSPTQAQESKVTNLLNALSKEGATVTTGTIKTGQTEIVTDVNLSKYYYEIDHGAACRIAEVAKAFVARSIRADSNEQQRLNGLTEGDVSNYLAFWLAGRE